MLKGASALRHKATSKTEPANTAFIQRWLAAHPETGSADYRSQSQLRQGGPRASAACRADAAALSLKTECRPTQISGLKQADVQFAVVAETQSAWQTEHS